MSVSPLTGITVSVRTRLVSSNESQLVKPKINKAEKAKAESFFMSRRPVIFMVWHKVADFRVCCASAFLNRKVTAGFTPANQSKIIFF